MEREISAFQAKTHLSEFLRDAERGRSFIIRRRGKAVARLIPCAADTRDLENVVEEFRQVRRRGGRKLDVKKLIEEGRRA